MKSLRPKLILLCQILNIIPFIFMPLLLVSQNKMYEMELQQAIEFNYFYGEQLARLKLGENKDSIYNRLIEKAKVDRFLCTVTLQNYELYKTRHSYFDGLMYIDTSAYSELVQTCKAKMLELGLENISHEKVKEQYYDSAKLPDNIITMLDTILFDDQYFRNLEPFVEKIINTKRYQYADSINLIKIRSIINQYGFLDENKMSDMHSSTLWLVLHHQSSCSIRQEFQPLLEQAFTDNKISAVHLDAYKRRTKRNCSE